MKIMKWLLPLLLLPMGIIQFIPSTPVVPPVELPVSERASHRLLEFEGIANFRDLGGYQTTSHQRVKWGVLYRSATFATASRSDLSALKKLELSTLIDFRSATERDSEPNVLPEPLDFQVVEIPILDKGAEDITTKIMAQIESGDYADLDPDALMLEGNRYFANQYTPGFRQFIRTVIDAKGQPIIWHCTAGKDRTGYAAAILLRILGVPMDTIMMDYMASKTPSLASRRNQLRLLRLFKGDEAADKLTILMGVEEPWLEAAFSEITQRWGSFDNYVRDGLQSSAMDIEQLRSTLLE